MNIDLSLYDLELIEIGLSWYQDQDNYCPEYVEELRTRIKFHIEDYKKSISFTPNKS